MKRPEIEAVWQYIDAHREEYLSLLKKFCSQPSVSAQNWGMREMAQIVCETIRELGADAKLFEPNRVRRAGLRKRAHPNAL